MPTTPQGPTTRMAGPNILPLTSDSTNYSSLKRKLPVDPTYSPTLDRHIKNNLTEDAFYEEQMLRDAVPERTGRKVRIVDPSYNPKHEAEYTDDEATAEDSRKRKRTGATGKESVTKRAKGSTSTLGLKQRSPNPEYAIGTKGHSSPKKVATPESSSSTPTSLGKDLVYKSHSLLEPDSTTPMPSELSWDTFKSSRKTKGASKSQEDELYLPSRITVQKQPAKRCLPRKGKDDEDWMSDEDDEYMETGGVSKNEKNNVVYDFSLEKAKRLATAVSLPDTWSKAEKELFFRLAMRGFEPLLPRHWQLDFSTLPQTLFPILPDRKGPLIRPFRESDFHAIKSLANLFALGGQVRDCSILQTRPEIKVKQAIRKYIGWALHDANIKCRPGAIPVYTIHAQKKGESVVAAVSRLNRRLETLCKRYHEALGISSLEQLQTPHQGLQSSSDAITVKQEPEDSSSDQFHRYPPLLVGFIICGPIVAILTLDTDPLSPKDWASGDAGSKFISQFDVGERGQDVWTSLAVAITTMHIRQTMVRLAEDAKGGFYRSVGGVSYASDEDL